MLPKYPSYSMWFSDDDGDTLVALMGIEDDGQLVLIGSERFGPFDSWTDVVNWLWARLALDMNPSKR